MVNPDGILTRENCGIWAGGSLDILRTSVQKLWNNHNLADELASVSHSYVLEKHEAEARLVEFEACIVEQARKERRPVETPWCQKWRRFHTASSTFGRRNVG